MINKLFITKNYKFRDFFSYNFLQHLSFEFFYVEFTFSVTEMNAIWEAAKIIIEEHESQVLTEMHTINGEERKVWCWQPITKAVYVHLIIVNADIIVYSSHPLMHFLCH